MIKQKFPVTFIPHNIGIPLTFLVFGSSLIRLLLWLHSPYGKLISYLLLLNLGIILYFFYYFFIYSKIVVFQDKLISPRTSYNGFPSGFIFGRKVINMHSIFKIIKYPAKWGKPFSTFGNCLYGSKISIISKPANNIQISYGFYGEKQIENLIQKLLYRNENIQVLEYDKRKI